MISLLQRLGLRARLILSLMFIIGIAMGLAFSWGYGSFKRSLDHDLEQDFEQIAQALDNELFFNDERVPALYYLSDDPLLQYGDLRFRIRREEEVFVEGGGSFPARVPPWSFYTQELEYGYVLELALDHSEDERELVTYIRSFSWALPITFAITAVLVWWLSSYFLQPLKKLNSAALALSKQEFPQALEVPPRNDEISQLTHSFNVMTQELRDAFYRERSFTRYASHELRTPLSTIQAQTEALEYDILDKETVVQELKQASQDMLYVLEALLALSRSKKLELSEMILNEALHKIVAKLPEPIKTRLNAHISPVPLVILGHMVLLQQLILNVMNNAAKYSKGDITLTSVLENKHALVSIQDQGEGIPEAHLHQVTQAFFRVHQDNAGSGLGLALSKDAVLQMNGELHLHNTAEGLRVEIRIPLV